MRERVEVKAERQQPGMTHLHTNTYLQEIKKKE
jgi:hypothetical protein